MDSEGGLEGRIFNLVRRLTFGQMLWSTTIISVVLTNMIASVISVMLFGSIRPDYLLTGTLTALPVSFVLVNIISPLIRRPVQEEPYVIDEERIVMDENYSRLSESRLSYLAKVAALSIVYYVTAQIGLEFDPVSGFTSLVWPATGIALAALLLFGLRMWPGIFIGAFAINFMIGAPIPVALAMALGNTLEALVGASLLSIVGFRKSMRRVEDTSAFILFAAILSTVISATIGVSALLLGGMIDIDSYANTWIAWWIGDMLGYLIVVPFLILWAGWLQSKKTIPGLEKITELAMMFLVFAIISAINFSEHVRVLETNPFAYFQFIPVVWAAIRFGPLAAATMMVLLFPIAVSGTVNQIGPFIGDTPAEGLLLLQIFMAILSVTSLVLAAVESERRRSASELRKLNNELAGANKELKGLDRMKDQFLMITSHELKTPLTPAIIQAQMLLEGHFGKLSTEQTESVRLILRNSKDLNKLVNDITDVSAIKERRLKLRPSKVQVTDIIGEATESMYQQASSKGIVIEKKIRRIPKVTCDPARINQVMLNLMDNALKFTPENGSISVEAYRSGGEIMVNVRDSGIGIDDSDLKHLFTPFFQVNPSYMQSGKGVGLGLSICRGIVEAHGGRIWAESRAGSGSTISFTLPLRADFPE